MTSRGANVLMNCPLRSVTASRFMQRTTTLFDSSDPSDQTSSLYQLNAYPFHLHDT